MNLADVHHLPPTLSTHQAAELLGVGVDHLWRLAREGTAPVEPLRLGRALRWPTPPLLHLLGLADPSGESSATPDLKSVGDRGEHSWQKRQEALE